MAWAGTTTEHDCVVCKLNGVVLASTNYGYSSLGHDVATGKIPGSCKLSTGTDVVRFPFNQPNGKMIILGEWSGSVITTACYPGILLRKPESSDGLAWRSPADAGTSTAESGWERIYSTAAILCATSQAYTVAYGPFESAKYGNVFLSASSNGINIGQPYLEVMFQLSSVGSTDTLVNTTTLNMVVGNVMAFELP